MKNKTTLLILLAVLFVIAASYQTIQTVEGINECCGASETTR